MCRLREAPAEQPGLEPQAMAGYMIEVTRLDGKTYYVNPHQIESVECNPDSTLTMLSGKRLVVKEEYGILLERVIEYRSRIGGFKNEE